jgi:phage shock protein A
MGLFDRISDIISANLNDMAEQFEDPEKMLKQAVREMEESIVDARNQTAKAMASEKLVERELANNEKESANWKNRAEQAVRAGDDELARKALQRKQEHDKLAVALRDQLAAARDASQTLRHQFEAMQAKLAEAKRTLATLSARQRAADVRKRIHTQVIDEELGFDDGAFAKFDRLRERVAQTEAEAEALAELEHAGGKGPDSVSDPTTVGNDSIDDQLEALKRGLK